MAGLSGKTGKWKLDWLSVPRGPMGSAQLKLESGETLEVRWRRDAEGLWLELPDGVHGFDIVGRKNDDGAMVYRVSERVGDQVWHDLAFLRAGDEQAAGAAGGKKKGLRIRAQMPGKIVRILAKAGDSVEKDQPLLVMEAMKMENEIRAAQAGVIKEIKVSEGQAVENGADLAILE